ncbi:MAG TPA: phenylalanine--tRNA ligase beta subunit-related protein [Terriglobia bacterium]|nr:phenylalanine--tRNA ligase beta subunit-related protein [Terriglobia bacterium]
MLTIEVDNPDLLVGTVYAVEVPQGPAGPELSEAIDTALSGAADREARLAGVRLAIRDLLRAGGYKPAGRGKPASEYLAQAASRGEFPRISHIVDALNLVSLESGLPISLLDWDRAAAGDPGLVIRLGRPGESFVFNPAGHEIQIEGLLSVARANGPALGNPVKDSMAAKTTTETRNVFAVVWASRRAISAADLAEVCNRLGYLLGGTAVTVRVVEPS